MSKPTFSNFLPFGWAASFFSAVIPTSQFSWIYLPFYSTWFVCQITVTPSYLPPAPLLLNCVLQSSVRVTKPAREALPAQMEVYLLMAKANEVTACCSLAQGDEYFIWR